jgi:hypothetical protein
MKEKVGTKKERGSEKTGMTEEMKYEKKKTAENVCKMKEGNENEIKFQATEAR